MPGRLLKHHCHALFHDWLTFSRKRSCTRAPSVTVTNLPRTIKSFFFSRKVKMPGAKTKHIRYHRAIKLYPKNSDLTKIGEWSIRDHLVYALSQWETTLRCNVVSHWLGAYTKWFLASNLSNVSGESVSCVWDRDKRYHSTNLLKYR